MRRYPFAMLGERERLIYTFASNMASPLLRSRIRTRTQYVHAQTQNTQARTNTHTQTHNTRTPTHVQHSFWDTTVASDPYSLATLSTDASTSPGEARIVNSLDWPQLSHTV